MRARWHATRRRRCLERAALRAAAATALALIHCIAAAQVSGTASLLTDYRYRGVSFSDDKPAAQVALNYDHASGWYAGLFASTIRFASPPSRGVQTLAFAGYAQRTRDGPTLEIGADYAVNFVGASYKYPEVYVGIASDNLSARLYYAPRYYTGDADTFYAEANATIPIEDRARAVLHAGALHVGGTNTAIYYTSLPTTFDARAGVVFDVERFAIQLAWVGVSSNLGYPMTAGDRRHTVVLSVSRSF